MKIKHNDLQKLYKAYIVDRVPQSRKKCPHPKEIINFFNSRLNENKISQLIDHITNCFYCAQEFEFIIQTLREQEKLSEEIGNLLRSENFRMKTEKRVKEDALRSATKKRFLFPVLSLKYILPFLVAAIIISALILFKKTEKIEYRDESIPQINLIEPINGKYFKSSSLFKWTEIKNSSYYILEIFDETLYPVWESNKISRNYSILPEEALKKLFKNKAYFWMVTAYFSNGRKIESILEEFIPID
jgi:hypothetical protein